MKFTFLFFLLLTRFSLSAQIITTVAGNGTFGYSGDGGLATDAELGDTYFCYPAFDKAGNMYIAQNFNNTIRKVDKIGRITTIAGTNGVFGYTGDGGPAVNALLYHPTALAVDKDDNLIISDRNGGVLRKIDPSGIITTISGQFTNTCGAGDGGPLAQAQFFVISAITIDREGNLYISDYGCNTVRKVNTSGIITTIAGGAGYGFSGDGGPATAAKLAYPVKVAVDNAGNVYIPDAQNHRIRKVTTSGIITTIAGNGIVGYSGDGGPALIASFYYPGAVVIDTDGNLYVSDYNNVVRKIDPSGTITTFAGTGKYGYTGDGGPALLADLAIPEGGISIDDKNNIYFAGEYTAVIRKISSCLTASITAQPVHSILCNTGNTVFTIIATNADSYQWQVKTGSAWNDVSDNNTYKGTATNTLNITAADAGMNANLYRCIAANYCGNVFSPVDTLTVTSPVTPAVSISTNSNTSCKGVPVIYTATAVDGGSSPLYQWKKNGLNVGSNTEEYTDNALSNGDIITCMLTNSDDCVTKSTATSNNITAVVNQVLTPSITILPSANNVCYGVTVSFSSIVSNAGTNPVYQWKKNGLNVGTNTPDYSDNALNNGDIITCQLTPSYSCKANQTASSNTVAMSITPLATPAVVINSSETTVCPGTTVTFDAVASTAASSVSYQWQKNGLAVGNDNPIYSDSLVMKPDAISCKIIVSGKCLTTESAVSNSIKTTVFQSPVVLLDHSSSLCEGGSRMLDAGKFSGYLWNSGSTSRSIQINDTGTYRVTVKDNNGCSASDSVMISTLLAKPINFLPGDTVICKYGSLDVIAKSGYKNYLWNDNLSTNRLNITKPGVYSLEVTDNNNCKGKDTINVILKDCLSGFYIPTAFTPNQDRHNDVFRPLLFGNILKYHFYIYNRWGRAVFETSDPTKGWDGNLQGEKQDMQTFVWFCVYQLEGEKEEQRKGKVILVR